MLGLGHRLLKWKGLVGRAAETGAVVLVSDTSQSTDWLPNPLLPDTQSEIAVPIIFADEVLGVLDVQQNVVNGIAQQDVVLLQIIASQVAVALRNASLYDQARVGAEREARINAIVEQIRQTTTVEGALQVAVREVGRMLGTKASVRLELKSISAPARFITPEEERE